MYCFLGPPTPPAPPPSPHRATMPRRRNPKPRQMMKAEGGAQAEALRAEGLSPEQVFRNITASNVAHMERTARERGRCLSCWQTARHGCCICGDMQPVEMKVPMRILVWCHARDYLNAGDDAKLLRCCVAGAASTELAVFGTSGDAVIEAAVQGAPERSMLLFPDDDAVTIGEFLARQGPEPDPVASGVAHARGSAGVAPQPSASEGGLGQAPVSEPLTVVVLNGTWSNVKPMLRYFNKSIDPTGAVRHVALAPTTLSVCECSNGLPPR